VDGLTGLLSGGQGSESTGNKGRVLKSGKLDDVRRSIEAAIADVRSGPKVLIIDQLDELLAIFGEEDVTGLALEGTLLSLREVSSAQAYLSPLIPRKKWQANTSLQKTISVFTQQSSSSLLMTPFYATREHRWSALTQRWCSLKHMPQTWFSALGCWTLAWPRM